MSNNYTVYVHINKTNGKRYYGITCQKIETRWRGGKGYCYKGKTYFSNAIKKYGWDGFEHIIIACNLTEDEAKWLEVEMIAVHNTTNPKFGYNMTIGGDSANGLKGETHPNYGKHLSEETRAKISESRKDKYGKNASNIKPVICITTKRVFYTIKDAANYYSLDNSTIAKCCRGKRKSCGKLNEQPLKWKFLNYKHNKTYRVA